MLDKELCVIFGIDAFTQHLMKELDYVEDQLYDLNISPIRYIELKAKYDTLKSIRDVYCAIKNKK